MVEDALAAEGVSYNRSIYTPFVTLCTFLSQVLDPDHSCRAAVARVIVWMAIHDRKPCSEQTGTYCDARLRLPLEVVVRLVRRTGHEIEAGAAADWLWKGRRVLLVDGTTASMPDTPRNQAAFPQPNSQAKGIGFPVVRMVAIIALATGVVLDLATGPYAGKETGETALFRELVGPARARRDRAGGPRLRLVLRHPRPLRAGRRRAVPDAPAAEVRLPPRSTAGGRGPCGDLDQAGPARLDGRGDLPADAGRAAGCASCGSRSSSRGSESTSWCW